MASNQGFDIGGETGSGSSYTYEKGVNYASVLDVLNYSRLVVLARITQITGTGAQCDIIVQTSSTGDTSDNSDWHDLKTIANDATALALYYAEFGSGFAADTPHRYIRGKVDVGTGTFTIYVDYKVCN